MAGLFRSIMSVIGFVPPAIVLAGCIILWRHLQNEGTVLMLIGGVGDIAVRIVQVALTYVIMPHAGSMGHYPAVIYGLLVVSVIASLLFAFGLLRFARGFTVDE